MKILYLVHSLDPASGWGRLAREVINRMIKAGIKVEVLTEVGSKFPGEKVILKRSWPALLSCLNARKYFKKTDLVHSFEANPYAIIAYLAGIGLNKKNIITTTGAYSVQSLYRFSTKIILKRVYRKAKKILCISRYIEKEIKRKVNLNNTKVITLGVDFKRFSGNRKKSLERFILGVGNLGFRKGYHVSIPAFAEVAKRTPNIKYYIAGRANKEILDKYQWIVEKYNLKDRVVFLGSLNDKELKKLYLSAELFILTSVNIKHHFEGFGLVFLEAASAGLPVIGTSNCGITDAVLENKNGLLVPQNDIKATAQAMLKILTNSDLKNRFSKTSIKWAKENSWDNVVKKYIKVYEDVISNKGL